MTTALQPPLCDETAPIPEPDLTHLEQFEAWINSPDGLAFWRQFDADCYGNRHACRPHPLWGAIYEAKGKLWPAIHLPHNFVPVLSRLWMLWRDEPGFFKQTEMRRCTEVECEAVCRRIIDGWRAAA